MKYALGFIIGVLLCSNLYLLNKAPNKGVYCHGKGKAGVQACTMLIKKGRI